MTSSVIALILAQAAAAAEPPKSQSPVAVSATASVRIIAAPRLDFASLQELANQDGGAVTVTRDAQGTTWFEFT
ncbi:hypothetical protein [Altererythrobacter sp. MF3-039]|uniref:hypothetical protein n=1 Tax=Altererythrobacter sp. MF3-039 TaxID=3252901 RepID=UPI00390CA967